MVKRHVEKFIRFFSIVFTEEASTICRSPYLGADFIRLSGSSGTLFSPDFPVPYPRNAICIWTITVPAGKRVKLTFENFALSTSSSGCRQGENDYVEVRDTLHEYGRELGYYCDFNTPGVPADVYSSRRYMWVKFFSGSGGVFQRKYAKGFKARFEAVDKPGKCTVVCLREHSSVRPSLCLSIYCRPQYIRSTTHSSIQPPIHPSSQPATSQSAVLTSIYNRLPIFRTLCISNLPITRTNCRFSWICFPLTL